MDPEANSLDAPLVSIVDDDLSVRRSTRRLLRAAGFWVEAFASAEEFLTSGASRGDRLPHPRSPDAGHERFAVTTSPCGGIKANSDYFPERPFFRR